MRGLARQFVSTLVLAAGAVAAQAATAPRFVPKDPAFVVARVQQAVPDAALRELIARHPDARDIEVRGAGLEEAFVQLTADDEVAV